MSSGPYKAPSGSDARAKLLVQYANERHRYRRALQTIQAAWEKQYHGDPDMKTWLDWLRNVVGEDD